MATLDETDDTEVTTADQDTTEEAPVRIPTIRMGSDDEDEGTSLSNILAPKRDRSKPVIDHLADAVVRLSDGTPVLVPEVGDNIVIERTATVIEGAPWLDTTIYKIVKVDDETGVITLWDAEKSHNVLDNFRVGYRSGSRVYKVPPVRGKWDAPPPKARINPITTGTNPSNPGDPNAPKRKRGRPPGTKNRSKEVIAAEKTEREAIKRAKRAARKAKRGV